MILRLCAALAFAVATVAVAAAAEPWIITGDVVITEPLEVGDVIVAGNGRLTVRNLPEPGLRVTGSIWVVGDAELHLESSVVQFMSTYHGQYALVGGERASIEVEGCDYRVPKGVQHALIAAGSASLVVDDTDFGDVQLISAELGRLAARRLNGRFEVIVQNDSTAELSDIPRDPGGGVIWVWVEFPSGSTAVYTPPMPGRVESWSFPPEGATGIGQRVTIERCETLLWPMLVREGSHLILRDIPEESWVVVGLYLPNPVTLSGLENGRFFEDAILSFDRVLELENASIDTWNLYPQHTARVTVRDSLVGEVLSMNRSSVRVERSTIDGSGGFFGARDQSEIVVFDSTITCTVEATQDATIELHHGEVLPYPSDPTGAWTRFGAYDRGRLFADQTVVATTPALGGDGLIGVSYIADPPSSPPEEPVQLVGSIGLFGLGSVGLEAWRLEATAADGGEPQLIAQGTENLEEAVIGSWAAGRPDIDHLLRAVLIDSLGRRLVGWIKVPGPGPRVRSTNGRRVEAEEEGRMHVEWKPSRPRKARIVSSNIR